MLSTASRRALFASLRRPSRSILPPATTTSASQSASSSTLASSADNSSSSLSSSPWTTTTTPHTPTRCRGPLPRLVQQQQRRNLFIQTESTPNPESIKFLPGRAVLTVSEGEADSGSGFYATRTDKAEIARSPLSKALFEIDGVKSVYLGEDFVTVTKYAEAHWAHIRTSIFGAIMDFYASGKEAVTEVAEITDTTIFEDDDEVVAMLKELLESRIRPAVQEDGGDIRYVGFDPDTGIVTVKLAGSCVGCPSSSVTLKQGVENMMMHYVPEVTGVEALEEEEEEDGAEEMEAGTEKKQMKSYEERLAAAGIPFSD